MLVLSLIAELLTTIWFFVLGACFGSFLNVVIYRLPRGITLLGKSRCPACGQAILFRDNIPVVGWIILRGRCRRCAQPISARYWQLELLVGMVWMLIAVLEIGLGGINLPVTVRPYRGFAFNLSWQNRDLILASFLHIGLLMQLLMWAMIECDGFALPRRWSLVFIGLSGVLVLACPVVHPACGWFPAAQTNQAAHLALEMSVAVCAGVALSALRPRTQEDAFPVTYAVFSVAAVGWSLGLAALPAVLLVASVSLSLVAPQAVSIAGSVWIATALMLLIWRPVNAAQVCLGFGHSAPGLILAVLVVLMIVPWLVSWMRARR